MTSSMSTTRYVHGTTPNSPVHWANSMRHDSAHPSPAHAQRLRAPRAPSPPQRVASPSAPKGMKRSTLSPIDRP